LDVDEHFAKPDIRLAQLTNKCNNGEDDLDYYIMEAGDILNIFPEMTGSERGAKHVLFHIFKQIVDFKKSDGGRSAMEGLVGDNGYGYGETPVAYEYDGAGNQYATAEAVPVSNKVLQALDNTPSNSNRKTLQSLDRSRAPSLDDGDYNIPEAKAEYTRSMKALGGDDDSEAKGGRSRQADEIKFTDYDE